MKAATAFDDFYRANGSLGSNWTDTADGGLSIVADQVIGTSSAAIAGDMWTGTSFGSDQYSEIELTATALPGGAWVGPTVRSQSDGNNAYLGIYDENNGDPFLAVYERISGGFTQLGSSYYCGQLSARTVLELSAVSSTITFSENGVPEITVTNSDISGGDPGVMTYNAATLQDWSGGDYTINPNIASFGASPNEISSGSSSVLSWNVSNASSVAITATGFNFSTSTLVGSTAVSPASTTVYTLTATNANGTSTAQGTVNVTTTRYATIALVNATSVYEFGNVSQDVSTTFPITTGNFIAVGCGSSDFTPIASATVTDTAGNTFIMATSVGNSNYHNADALFYAANAIGDPSDVITCNVNADSYGGIDVLQFSGVATTSVLDVAESAQGPDATDTITGLFSTSQIKEVAVAFGTVQNSVPNVFVAGGGYAIPTQTTSTGEIAGEYQIFDTPQTTVSSSMSLVSSDSDPVIALGTFVAATLPSGSPPVISSFSASPTEILTGSSSILSWNITNASSVAITPGSFATSTLAGSITVNPTSTTVYTVTATNANGTSTAQATVTLDTTPPTTPTSVTATATGTSTVTLSWASSTDAGGPGVAGYNIFRCTGSCTPSTLVATSSGASFHDAGLTASTTYTYAVSAYDEVGNVSGESSSTSVTTEAGGGAGGGNSIVVDVPSGGGGYISSGLPTTTSSSASTSTPPISIGSSAASINTLRSLSVELFDLANANDSSLTIGDRGTDVWALQVLLIIDNTGEKARNLGAVGPTGYFGPITRAAVQEYQAVNGIVPDAGYVGAKTKTSLLR